MKIILTILAILSALNAFNQNNTILYFPFDNDHIDNSSYKHEVISFGNIAYGEDRFGHPCHALYLDGNTWLEITHHSIFNTIKREFSLTAWINVEKNQSNENWLTLICKGDKSEETLDNPHFRVQILQKYNQSTVSINTDLTEYDDNYKNHLVPFNRWMFFCLTYDGSTIKMYFDNQKVWSFPYSGNLYPSKSSVFIGKDIPGNTEHFNGFLDDFMLFNYALSESDIKKAKNKNTSNGEYFTIICPEDKKYFVNNNSCNKNIDYLPNQTLDCGKIVYNTIKGNPSGSIFSVGENKVILSAEYGSYKEICSFNINILDTISPKIRCSKDTIVIVSEDIFQIKPTTAKASDNCKIQSIEKISGENIITTVGKHKIVYQAIDISGNKSNCSYTIDVQKKKLEQIDTSLLVESPIDTSLGIITYQNTYSCKQKTITLVAYDNLKEDNDTISIFFNNKEIVKKEEIKNIENGPIIRVVDLDSTINNIVVIKAWNMGTIGKNTVKLDIYNGDVSKKNMIKIQAAHEIKLISEPGLSPAIRLIYK